ncbi:Gfo/Idh/MocA family protein [Tautonia plasticadhaerens]|uniref:1,5-anhydro-D-fructose reductase n=1 Tax=Tautonia plasticadhaerens TaxID=2527974 RepID=A0A518H507_9BACT|nr:Gfo/Idh/MocA family oxidoreductase [Tautonia plasticadhaerens]QDV35922.1 1,5-anhydro-D-fructose reductase [Tautonia plasticadhaerens]
MDDDRIGLGVIGCGGFGLFALQQFTQVPGVGLVGMAATHRPASLAAASRFGVENTDDLGAFLGRGDLDVVYIATPPFLHHDQALAALEAGKHVIVEKPLAMTVGQADELIAVARSRDLLLVTNLMQRYNPLFDAVRRLVEGRVLGEVLRGSFENYASDENLPEGHWFWDRTRSGGIFVEHGVHFFDLFEGWLGAGRLESAQVGVRPGTAIEEHVHCTVRYGDSALVDFYHGFHQVGRMDRQELRLVFERGDLTLYDWVPTRVRIRALVDERQTRDLCGLFPGARIDVDASFGGKDRECRGRGKAIDASQVIELASGDGQSKSPLYCRLLRAMMGDQVAWLRDRTHRRVVTESNGRESLAVACEADAMAHQNGVHR